MRPNKLFLLAGFVLLLCCTSCISLLSTKSELKLGANETWDFKATLVVDSLDSVSKSELIMVLNETIVHAQNMGVKGEWNEETGRSNPTYQIELSGAGYDSLNKLVFSGYPAVVKENDQAAVFYFDARGSLFESGLENSFTLISWSIDEGDLTVIRAPYIRKVVRKVVWTDFSSPMRAYVLTRPSRNYWIVLFLKILIGLCMVGIAVGIGIVVSKYRRKWNKSSSLNQSPVVLQYCINCGKQIPAQSQFCPFCGQNITR